MCLTRAISSNKTPAATSNATQCRRMNVRGLRPGSTMPAPSGLPAPPVKVESFTTASPHTRSTPDRALSIRDVRAIIKGAQYRTPARIVLDRLELLGRK
jgi:hypothetical protein